MMNCKDALMNTYEIYNDLKSAILRHKDNENNHKLL